MHNVKRWAASLAAAAGAVTAGGAWAGDATQAQQHHEQGQHTEHGQSCPAGSAKPVLSVGDFNGDAIVNGEDIRELTQRILRRDNVAFFDMNADGLVDMHDLRTVSDQVGARSTALDQELAAVFRATERYRDIGNAIADDFIPYTPSYQGHGVHWGRRQAVSGTFELTRPQGLNYSEDGRLLAVFYAYMLDGTNLPDAPPAGLSGDEPWHSHWGLCFGGVDQANPTYDFRALSLEMCVPQQECKAPLWIEKLYMIHLWLYEQNPCGVFGFDNPRITEGSTVEEAAARCPPEEAHGDHAHGAAHGTQSQPAMQPQPAMPRQQAGKQQAGTKARPQAQGQVCLPPAPAMSPPGTAPSPAPAPAPAAPPSAAPHTHEHAH